MPQLTIVVVDTIPIELKTPRIWCGSWFVYVLRPPIYQPVIFTVIARRSLRPIEALAREVRELEDHHREMLNPETTRELTSLVRNLLINLLKSERERYNKIPHDPVTDLTHSLKRRSRFPEYVTPYATKDERQQSFRTGDAETDQPISSRFSGYYSASRASGGSGVLLPRTASRRARVVR